MLFLFGTLFFTSSCGAPKESTTNQKYTTPKVEQARKIDDMKKEELPFVSDFIAKGSDGSWSVFINYKEGIAFVDKNRGISILTENLTKNVTAGTNVVSISSQSKEYELKILIDVVDCESNEGKIINIMLRKNGTKNEIDYEGCGNYQGSQQLNDIWVVQELNGKKLDESIFSNGLPTLEFNLKEGKVGGNGGCNQINGGISFNYDQILFSKLATTRMYCNEASDIENEILSILRLNPSYKIDNLTLHLELPKKSITLKKID